MPFSDKLVSLIERNADSLSRKWAKLVQTHPSTSTYHDCDPDKLFERAFRVYGQLGSWVSQEMGRTEVAKQYTALGVQRRKEGVLLSELIQALIITRRVLWFEVIEERFLDTPRDFRLALELNNRVVQFFDRAVFFATIGYEHGEIECPEPFGAVVGSPG
jgi:hypothetical protein